MAAAPDTDWDALQKALWREVLVNDGRLEAETSAFIAEFTTGLRADGWTVSPENEARLAAYVDSVTGSLDGAIGAAVKPVALATQQSGTLASEFVRKQIEAAFRRRWDDDLQLSDRVWSWGEKTRNGVLETVAQGARVQREVGSLVMDMQRTVEALAGQRFAAVAHPPGMESLEGTLSLIARTVAPLHHDPESMAKWKKALAEARGWANNLRENGTAQAAKRFVRELDDAVLKGSEAAADNALRWFIYDKQLYNMKRIARTEMATAHHNALIEGTEQQDWVIGYHWRLSASHPDPDICDYYADVEFGLGKGVWPKDQVPRAKAHPHCMCALVPRVTPRQVEGSTSYGDFLERLPESQRAAMMPRWAQDMTHLGLSPSDLVASGSDQMMTREAMRSLLGEERADALQALGRSMREPAWPNITLRLHGAETQRTLAALGEHTDDPEVKRLLDSLQLDPAARRVPVDSRQWHYLKRRYQDGVDLKGVDSLDRYYDQVLGQKDSQVYVRGEGKGRRYLVHSPSSDWIAITDARGRRITTHPRRGEIDGEPQWTIQDLIASTPTTS
ncbi:hypothetical protein [Endothiovibrio diazotrophicus]